VLLVNLFLDVYHNFSLVLTTSCAHNVLSLGLTTILT